jgi:O-antigen ligase
VSRPPRVGGAARPLPPAPAQGTSSRIELALAWVLAAGTVILPLVFTIANSDVFALPKTIAMLALTVVLLCGVAWLAIRRRADWTRQVPPELQVLAVYLVLTTAATAHSADPLHSLVGERLQYQGLLATLGYAVAFLVARVALADARRIRWLGVALVAAAVVVAGYGLAQQTGHDPIWHVLDRGRIFSTLGQSNALAAYLVLAFPVGLALAWTSGQVGRFGWAAAAVAIGITAMLTMSRGGFLGLGAVVLVLGALLVRRSAFTRRRLAAVAGAALLALVVVVTIPGVSALVGRVIHRESTTAKLDEGSIAMHLDLWAVGVRIALDYPVLGVGPETYPALFPTYRNRVLPHDRAVILARFRPESPHDVPIAIADAAGLPALAAYLAFLGLVLSRGWRRMRGSSGTERLLLAALLAAIVGHFVTDLFMTAEVTGSWIAWVAIGILAAPAVASANPHAAPGGEVPVRALTACPAR